MFKSLLQKANVAIASIGRTAGASADADIGLPKDTPASRAGQRPPRSQMSRAWEEAGGGMPPLDGGTSGFDGLDLIVVPQSAMDALEQDPNPLVDAVVAYVNTLLSNARYIRTEIPLEAIQAFHCDYYLAQVNNGGHAQFVGNSRAILELAVEDIQTGLQDMGADAHVGFARDMAAWIARNPDEVAAQTGFEGGIARELAALDQPFFDAEKTDPLRRRIADWVAGLEITQVVPDDEVAGIMDGLAMLNPAREARGISADIAGNDLMLRDPLRLGLGMAGAAGLEPLVAIAGGTSMKLEGKNRTFWLVRSNAGKRYGLLTETGAALFEYVPGSEATLKKPLSEITPNDMRDYQSPALGAMVCEVTREAIDIAREVCIRIKAAAAVDLLLRRLPDPVTVDFISVRSAGPGPDKVIGASIFVICNGGSAGYTAIVKEDGAHLLSEPDHGAMGAVTMSEIEAHATRYARE